LVAFFLWEFGCLTVSAFIVKPAHRVTGALHGCPASWSANYEFWFKSLVTFTDRPRVVSASSGHRADRANWPCGMMLQGESRRDLRNFSAVIAISSYFMRTSTVMFKPTLDVVDHIRRIPVKLSVGLQAFRGQMAAVGPGLPRT
jgi:hypothetical protein